MKLTNAPDLTPGYPSKGSKIGPAWEETWAELSRYPEDWRDGTELWTTIAAKHDLHPDTLRGLMFRMATGGKLQRKTEQVITDKGKRTRTYFRIAPVAEGGN